MTSNTMPTAQQFLTDFNSARKSFNQASADDLGAAFKGSTFEGIMPTMATGSISSFLATTGVTGVAMGVASIGAALTGAGLIGLSAAQYSARKKAGQFQDSLEVVANTASSAEDLVRGQQTAIANYRADNEVTTLTKEIGNRAVTLGILTCGFAAGALMVGAGVAAAPLVAPGMIIAGLAGVGAVIGDAYGKVRGQERTSDMMDRILARTHDLSGTINTRNAKRAGQDGDTPSVDPGTPRVSF